MQNTEAIIKSALNLTPQERVLVIESLINSIDNPDKEIDEIWAEEAEKRLKAYEAGKLETFSYKEVFGENL
jgi:putative addiction module component (TIGR02574 family)